MTSHTAAFGRRRPLLIGAVCLGAGALALATAAADAGAAVKIDRANSSRSLIPGERAVIQASVPTGQFCRLAVTNPKAPASKSPIRRATRSGARYTWRIPSNLASGTWRVTLRCAASKATLARGKGSVARVSLRSDQVGTARGKAARGAIGVKFSRPLAVPVDGKGGGRTCKRILVIGARGSGENVGFGDQVFAFVKQIVQAPNIGTETHPAPLKYDAVPVSGFNVTVPGNISGAWTKLPGVGRYHDSVVQGKLNLELQLIDNHFGCPPNYVVLAGYSQGAQVVGDVYQSLSPQLRERVFGVVLFGDPYFNPADKGAVGDFSTTTVFGRYLRYGSLGMRRQYPTSSVFLRTYCRKNDPICQGPGAINKKTHSQYNTGQAQDAGRWMSTQLRARLRADDEAAARNNPSPGTVEAPGPGSTTTPNTPVPPTTTQPPSGQPEVPPTPTTPPPATRTYPQQQATRGVNTFTNPQNASGMGPRIEPRTWVEVSCKVHAPQIISANPDGYWYRIASAPWNNAYYSPANTFWNGDVEGQKPYTHNTDWNVPDC